MSDRRARYRGCLLGGATGDALGAPVERLRRKEILARFGPLGIRDHAPAYGRVGAITDDTQLTLFTADGLLRSWVRGRMTGTTTEVGVTSHAYLRWLATQGYDRVEVVGDQPVGWLIQHEQLHQRRGPGRTCTSALMAMQNFGEPARNNSKACGGVMRAAPAGLFVASIDPNGGRERAFTLGADLAALTHGHPTGSLAAGALAALIYDLVTDSTLGEALPQVRRILAGRPGHEETLGALIAAEALVTAGRAPHDCIAELGRGWVAEEALAIAVYCALVAEDFQQGVVLAVNHDGDSDSTGSITGNLLGAELGLDAVPLSWLATLELHNVIAEIADDLCEFPQWRLDPERKDAFTDRLWEKYPGF